MLALGFLPNAFGAVGVQYRLETGSALCTRYLVVYPRVPAYCPSAAYSTRGMFGALHGTIGIIDV